MTSSFGKDVDLLIEKNIALLTAVARQSIEDVVDQASLAKAKGGRMPVKTGFLRQSGKSSLSGFPTGPARGDPNISYPSVDNYSQDAGVQTTLASLNPGETFYFGWTAEYANIQNVYNGFLDAAIQNWPTIVRKNAANAIKRMNK